GPKGWTLRRPRSGNRAEEVAAASTAVQHVRRRSSAAWFGMRGTSRRATESGSWCRRTGRARCRSSPEPGAGGPVARYADRQQPPLQPCGHPCFAPPPAGKSTQLTPDLILPLLLSHQAGSGLGSVSVPEVLAVTVRLAADGPVPVEVEVGVLAALTEVDAHLEARQHEAQLFHRQPAHRLQRATGEVRRPEQHRLHAAGAVVGQELFVAAPYRLQRSHRWRLPR